MSFCALSSLRAPCLVRARESSAQPHPAGAGTQPLHLQNRHRRSDFVDARRVAGARRVPDLREFCRFWSLLQPWHPTCAMRRDEKRIHTARAAGRPPFRRPAVTPSGPFHRTGLLGVWTKSQVARRLDIGSSAVKAVELKAGRQGLQGRRLRHRAGPARQHRRRRHHRRRAPSPTPSAASSRASSIKTKDVAASLSGNAVIVKKITLPVMTEAELAESIYWEAEQYIPFDIQDVNLDYQILDAGSGAGGKGDDGRPARRGEEGKDRRLHRRHRPGRARRRSSSTSTPSRCRTPTK